MPTLVNRSVKLILGKTGSGKTTLARQFVSQLPRVLIIDSGFCEFPAQNFTTLRDLHKYLDNHGGAGGNFRASFTPLKKDIPVLFRWARELGKPEEITLVLEECDRFPTPDSAALFEDIIQRGRHYGVNMICLTTHPYAVDIDLRRQATEIYSFRQHEPADIKWLGQIMPAHVVGSIIGLGDYEYIRWNAKTGLVAQKKTEKK